MTGLKPQKSLIAVCGKGGSGMAKHLIQSGQRRLLMIDADPTMNLAPVLGMETGRTINDIREGIIKEARSAKTEAKYQLAHSLDYMLLETLTETDSFSLLV
ncbi:MAG: carbon monoxide dehydrogenase maturation protein, partial [Deltaproteobacteria bacterium]|nr:carbon monoxide dehydrogenase maturation protein [Deltaproteobacteria bacterium]